MKAYRILIVEDEFLIADNLEQCLREKGYEVVGKAISYREAVRLFEEKRPNLALIDIRLNGPKSGIDFAHFLRAQPGSIPFVYLTSHRDQRYLEAGKATFPAGFLYKPIGKENLFTTLEVALYNSYQQTSEPRTIRLRTNAGKYSVPVADISYFKSEHVYVRIYLVDEQELIIRSSLQDLLGQLPAGWFGQTHRSYAVNLTRVERWDAKYVYLPDLKIPLSRSRQEEVLAQLDNIRARES